MKKIKPRIPTLVPPNKIMKSKKDYDRKKLKVELRNIKNKRARDRPFIFL
jgi:hypothetical protein